MANSKRDYRYGRIIGCYLLGRNGKRSLHPAVIVSPDNEIIQPEAFDPRNDRDNLVAVIGISTQYKKFDDPFLSLPYMASGHPMTGLTRDCAVILNWYAVIAIPDDSDFLAGDVPGGQLRKINDAIRRDLTAELGRHVGTFAQLLALLHPRS
ncbi:MAG TPA: hypothetical protein VGN88_01130 [Phycisphaerae bacterium]